MILCFNCSRETKEILDHFLESGEYSDYGEIIAMAVSNLAVLHAEIKRNGSLVFGTESNGTYEKVSEAGTYYEMREVDGLLQTTFQTARPNSQEATVPEPRNAIPAIFLSSSFAPGVATSANMPSDVWMAGQEVPIDRWSFGQYNRLLPVKASCRALANLLGKKQRSMLLTEVVENIVPAAAILGDLLRSLDEQHGISRDDMLSTAFPSRSNDGEKSRRRYANQFVASVNREGQLSGLLVDLKLMNRVSGNKIAVSLTEPGWEFAFLRNPVLDGSQVDPTQKFSDEEIDFLTQHISRHVPAEDFAFRSILRAIQQGADTPDLMDEFLGKEVPVQSDRELSISFLSTQRSGAVSRMTDLDLVARIREGVNVVYAITERGKSYPSVASRLK